MGWRSSHPPNNLYSSSVKSWGSEFSSIRTRSTFPDTSSRSNGGGRVFSFVVDIDVSAFMITTSISGHCPMKVWGPPKSLKISFFENIYI